VNGYFRNPLVSTVAFVALSVLFFWFFHTNQPVKDTTSFLGEWTDPHGVPGNYIRFALKKVDLPKSPLDGIMDAYEGRATFHKHLDQDDTTVVWNFENTDNLRLNVHVSGKCSFAVIRMVDGDRMLVRFARTIEEASAEDVFEGPEVKALVRVREAKPAAE
jgi:hypothetical protein